MGAIPVHLERRFEQMGFSFRVASCVNSLEERQEENTSAFIAEAT
jgi:hypothetical protein